MNVEILLGHVGVDEGAVWKKANGVVMEEARAWRGLMRFVGW